MGMGGKGMTTMMAKIAKNSILRDKVNDQQSMLAKAAPQMIKNPKKRTNEERGVVSILGGN